METAERIPFQTLAITPPTVAAADLIPSQTPESVGRSVAVNQFATALTADLMPSQAPVTTLRKVSLLFQAYTSPATSAASASTIRPTGLAFMTALRAA